MRVQDNKASFAYKCSEYVMDFFEKELPEWAVYHDLSHTIETMEGCLEIGGGEDINENEEEILTIAAWFHDLGYVISADGHEEMSCNIAEEFLTEINYPEDKMQEVLNCIMATKTTRIPRTKLERIIRDADLISLGKEDYFISNNLLKKELELRDNVSITDEFWHERSIKFLAAHNYLTRYAQLKYGPQVAKNLEILKNTKIDN